MTQYKQNNLIQRAKKVHLNTLKTLVFLCSCLGNGTSAWADFQYFNESGIDFWKKSQPKVQTPKNQTIKPSTTSAENSLTLKEPSPSAFPWKKYLDPKNDDFFREGEYLPPAPFMEIARNPSDENIENWFKYLEAKNEITRRLQTKLTDYAAKHANKPSEALTEAALQKAIKSIPETQNLNSDAKRFRLRLYFDSKCPHCERMIETLKGLSKKGFYIELRQVDQDYQVRSRIPFPVASANKTELKQYQIESVPVLLVGDLKAKTYFKIQGYQDEQNVLTALSDFSHKKGGSNQ